MSQFIGNARPVARLEANDQSLIGNPWRMDSIHAPGADRPISFVTPWWPRTGFIGDMALDVSMMGDPDLWERPELTRGTNSRFGYQGVTRDVNNSPLGGCTVKLFRTGTDEKTTPDVTSDATTGEFVISTPYYEPHYIVTRKSGAPDVGGVSVSTSYPNA